MADVIIFSVFEKSYASSRLAEEARKKDISLQTVLYKNLRFKIDDNDSLKLYSHSELIPYCKGIFIRALGEDAEYNPIKAAINIYFSGKSKLMNSKTISRWLSLDKSVQELEMQKAGIPFIETQVFGSTDEAESYYQDIKRYPVIVKDFTGSLGQQVYKIENRSGMLEFLKSYGPRKIKQMLFQKFLPGGSDIRVIYLNGRILGSMRRVARKGTFLTNFSQGGIVQYFDLSKEPDVTKIVKKVAKCFTLDYGGIDLMQDAEGQWKVIEINRACQFEGFEKSTGVNVASQIIDYLVKP